MRENLVARTLAFVTVVSGTALAAPEDSSAEHARAELRENPALAQDSPPTDKAPSLSAEPLSPAALRASLGWMHRPAEASSGVDYDVGLVWSGSVSISLLSWLNIGAYGGMEFHQATLSRNALGLGESARTVDLTGLRLGSYLEPTLALSPHFDTWMSLGVGWARFTADPLKLDASPGGLTQLPLRAGVLIEFPATLGLRFKPSADRLGFSLSGSFALTTGQTGDLFAANDGRRQAVSQDDGKIQTVAGFPKFGHALSIQASVDYSL